MDNEIIVAGFALLGTLSGTFGGIVTSAKLTNYRIKKLEEEVKEHNNFAKRMPVVETRIENLENRLDDFEDEMKTDNREIKNKLMNMTRRQ